jgi:hypothetical protein
MFLRATWFAGAAAMILATLDTAIESAAEFIRDDGARKTFAHVRDVAAMRRVREAFLRTYTTVDGDTMPTLGTLRHMIVTCEIEIDRYQINDHRFYMEVADLAALRYTLREMEAMQAEYGDESIDDA